MTSGALAGSAGVFISFPFDTLKTLKQTREGGTSSGSSSVSVWSIVRTVYLESGIKGFYGGVKGMVVGQAFIKAAAFSANDFFLGALRGTSYGTGGTQDLIAAAMLSGLCTSLLVTPVERVKIILQSSKGEGSELKVLSKILRSENGLSNLMFQGLLPTVFREVPSYGIYFVTYRVLMDGGLGAAAGSAAALVCGAMAGIACWIPVYPIDVVKTTMQATEGESREGVWGTLRGIVKEDGIGGLWDGLGPKVVRAAVNHAVTFWVFEKLTTMAV
ncbi:hypothetical protein TrRE_jg9576 [Triparma retinervis]|uniref:Mitochondrial carrier protein n=1 Tax=Triparma retinervis TaxID=2557542 RepID=A0A9W7G0B3_9STRA|nr:hypothetical protein TrRE_jg9576 [Triparma retinervis]